MDAVMISGMRNNDVLMSHKTSSKWTTSFSSLFTSSSDFSLFPGLSVSGIGWQQSGMTLVVTENFFEKRVVIYEWSCSFCWLFTSCVSVKVVGFFEVWWCLTWKWVNKVSCHREDTIALLVSLSLYQPGDKEWHTTCDGCGVMMSLLFCHVLLKKKMERSLIESLCLLRDVKDGR